ncbi:1-deoxy-D-xylulose-5-phosphate reductoisomerase, partial [Georgenia sp. 10Sc9-8]|nr:1-deoxy-D-xylulose-5-phosphate reductoisomerase [Georgenia halotolerans]
TEARRQGSDHARVTVRTGPEAATEVAGSLGAAGTVVNGITGSVGLGPTLAALRSGARLALANKESLVVGGPLVRQAQVRPGQVVPVDSEHSAIAQALLAGRHETGMTAPVVTGTSEVRRLVLTASGGPFRGRSRSELADVTPEQALAHPTWAMGPVVTVNSATLVNKGLELIEAHLLFDVPVRDITVVVHPQSVVHSMVEFRDGSTIAQASPPDMRLPIALGLTWPARPRPVVPPCAWDSPTAWTFEPLDEEVFPAVRLAREAAAASPTHPAVLNAANEQCVAAFLAGRLPYLAVPETVRAVLAAHTPPGTGEDLTLDTVLEVEAWARAHADELITAGR